MRRRAVLVVEYTVKSTSLPSGETRRVVPTAEKWERVFGGSGVGDLRVEVQEDKAWP